MQLNQSDQAYVKGKYDSSAAHTAKVAADKEKARLRAQANRDRKKAEAVAATAALLQLNAPHAPLLLPALVVAPLPIPPNPPLASSLQLGRQAGR